MALQDAFYIIGIIFMSLMLLLLIALVAAVFVIRSKVMSIHDKIEESLNVKSNAVSVGKKILSGAKSAIHKHS